MTTAFRTAALVLAVPSTFAFIQWVEVTDADRHMAAKRAKSHAVSHCHRAFGPQTYPEYRDDGVLICIGARGQKHGEPK